VSVSPFLAILPSSASSHPSPFLRRSFTVVYIAVVATRAGLLLTAEGTPIHGALTRTIDVAQMTNLALSLFINILGTLIIANKAWCVDSILDMFVCKHSMTPARQKEIPQVADEYRPRGPNDYTSNQNIGPSDRVWGILYFDWCEFRRPCTRKSRKSRVSCFSSHQLIAAVSLVIPTTHGKLGTILMPVTVQLAVRIASTITV
jgi:hypothetical protein